MAAIAELTPPTSLRPADIFSYWNGRFLFDLHQARRFVREGHEPFEVDEESVRDSLDQGSFTPEQLNQADPLCPGIIAHVQLQADNQVHTGHVLIDGHAQAARCFRDGLPFLAYVLSPEESRAILLKDPDRQPTPHHKVDTPVQHAPTTQRYVDKFQHSQPWAERSARVIAGATTHDRRGFGPFGVYVDHALGARKWDVAGNMLLDYWMGHGALLCGHGFTPVVQAVQRQIERGTHFGASHPLEVQWAELVQKLIPSAERVRFTASGTEATLLALRIARAATGRQYIIKFGGHFHGWHDESLGHFSSSDEGGFNQNALKSVGVADVHHLDSVVEDVARGQVAAVLLEPAGGSAGGLPWSPAMLQTLREVTRDHGTVLIFDEVISGFRHSPGGVQAVSGVIPDLTTLAKILCGGLPGGAVVGRADLMAVFGQGTRIGDRTAKVHHTGTFNANPLSAAAGIAMLEHIADGTDQEKARCNAEYLARGVNAAAEAEGVDVFLFTNGSSIYHMMIGARQAAVPLEPCNGLAQLQADHPTRYALLRRALLVEGLDTHPVHGWVSAVHEQDILDESIQAFARAFQNLRDVPGFGLLSTPMA
jgi:glutamate-1-semialdehyde 2,1-aminomutase